MKVNSNDCSNERGSVFFYVLLGVVLFATMSYVVTRSMRSASVDIMSDRQAEIISSDILSYANDISYAIEKLRHQGCSEGDISFERSPFDGSDAEYANPLSPIDFSCHIFHPDGGAASYNIMSEQVFKTTDNDWLLVANRVGNSGSTENWGSNQNDLTLMLSDIENRVCDTINTVLINDAAWPSSGTQNLSSTFRGGFGGSGVIDIRGDASLPPNAGCFCDAEGGACGDSDPRYFYYIVLER